jgi:ADP-ribose pyrophosphatase YjhB (NUDIX family)
MDVSEAAELARTVRWESTTMARADHYRDPAAPRANSVVPAAVAVVRNEAGELLLIRRADNDLWALPGGGHDIGERIAETAVREVEEETGILVEVEGLVGLYTDPEHVMVYDDGEVRQQFSISFRARPVGGRLRTSSESKEVRWVRPEELAGLDIHPSMRLRISHGLSEAGTEPYLG